MEEEEIELRKLNYEAQEEEFICTMSSHEQFISKMNRANFFQHAFPLTRIKTIIKFEEEVTILSNEFAPLMGKSVEFFIEEVTHSSWLHSEEERRTTLTKSDILTYINRSDVLDFLAEIFNSHAQNE